MAPFARGWVGALFEPRMSEHHLDPPLEMDSLPVQSPVIGKSQGFYKLARRDYAIGICLLLLVVFLWTTSNFVTQVRLCNHQWPRLSYLILATRTYLSVDSEAFPVCAILSSMPAVPRSPSRDTASRTSRQAHFRCTFYRF
jgi:hypothetical protein